MNVPYYQDDTTTLYHADNLTELSWLDADVLVTDPPYGLNWTGQMALRRSQKRKTKAATPRPMTDVKSIVGDNSTEARDAVLKLWGDKPAIIFGSFTMPEPSGTKAILFYQKPPDSGVRGSIGGFRRDVEAIYLTGNGWVSGTGGRSSVLKTASPSVGSNYGLAALAGGHPHSKPSDILAELLMHAPAGIVADPFAGGGSTLVAAKLVGRQSIGVEIEQKWCEVAARRLAQDCLPFG